MAVKKKKKIILRYGMRVRVTDKDCFYYGLTGTLSAIDPENPFVFVELDIEVDESEEGELHAVHMESVTKLELSDPDYDGAEFEYDDEEDDEDDEDEDEPEEAPMLVPLTGINNG